MRYWVYVLLDPVSLTPCYVGMTGKGLYDRLMGHVRELEKVRAAPRPSVLTERQQWLYAMAQRGDVPIMVQLGTYQTRKEATAAEWQAKKRYRRKGFDIITA